MICGDYQFKREKNWNTPTLQPLSGIERKLPSLVILILIKRGSLLAEMPFTLIHIIEVGKDLIQTPMVMVIQTALNLGMIFGLLKNFALK